jgi:hypothetical protein
MSIAVALYVIGFMETFVQQVSFTLTDNALNDTRIYGILMAIVLLLIALVGVGWVIKVMNWECHRLVSCRRESSSGRCLLYLPARQVNSAHINAKRERDGRNELDAPEH